MKTTIEEKIRLQRLQRGFSQENMADLLNLSTTAYGDIERGKTELTLSRLNQIATVLNISPVALLTDDALMVQVIQPDDETERDRETLRLTIEKQQLEIDKLRLEADYWKRKYDDRIALELLRSIGVEQTRERIGF